MNIGKGEVWAIIPARGGSKGVPGKNIKKLGGYPLIAYSIAVCKMSKTISRIVVSTDDIEIAKISKKYGAEVPFMRPAELAGDSSTDYEFMEHAINWFDNNEGKVPEYFAHIRVTTPLRKVEVVDEAINGYVSSEGYTSMRSAHKAAESPYKWYLMSDNNTFTGLVKNIDNEMTGLGRNEFPDAYIPDGYVDVLNTKYIVDNNKLYGDSMMAYESPVCTEVDTIEEFEYLEYLLSRNGSKIYDYLKNSH